MKKIIFILCFFMIHTAYANINSDLNHYFNSLGFSDNISAPNAYHGQEAGFYTGGSIFARNAVRDVQIMQVDLPSYRSGCGGIDLYAGGFSFVNANKMVEALQNVMNNAGSYAFTLALETATPELANVMKYVYDVANKINQANINSCETAESLVGGVWPKTRASQQQVCQDIGSNTNGIFTDWAQARQGCGRGGDFSSTMNKARNDPHYKNLVLDSGNLAWKAIQQNAFLQSDPELAAFFMSLSGTLIIKKTGAGDDATNSFEVLPSLADNNTLLDALLHGKSTKIYHCDTTDSDGCLNPTVTTVSLSEDNALESQVKKILESIIAKIYADQPLSPAEIGLLQSTSLPVYKMLNVQAAVAKDAHIIDVASYADTIAIDILFQYLSENMALVKASSSVLQYPQEILSQYQQNMDKALDEVRTTQKSAYSQMAISVQLVQQTEVLERMLAGDLSTQLASTLSWAKGLKS